MRPLCFVLMPFGMKTDGNKKEINFDVVYTSFIKPAIVQAGLEPIRADEEKEGGFIHKPMYERLLYCSFAVADLSFDNANVFYELGIRHATKPHTTVVIFEKGTKLSFDAAPLRAFPYEFTDGTITNLDQQTAALSSLIKINVDAQKAQDDSPIGQLLPSFKFPNLDYLKEDADCFADVVKSTNASKDVLAAQLKRWKLAATANDAAAQLECLAAAASVESEEGNNLRFNYDLLYALLKTYRSMGAFDKIKAMLEPVVHGPQQDNVYLQQQLAMAYNKVGQREEAEQILLAVIAKYGTDPETNGLLGAVYKGLMDDNKGDELLSAEYSRKAIEAYLGGFEADPRYFYPGVNALSLMFLADTPDERFTKFMPLVSYAVERLLETKSKDYWTQASALELAVLDMNAAKAKQYLASALFCNPDKWMKVTTSGNLQKIYNKAAASPAAGSLQWLTDIINRFK